jgi:hypothetical protein
VIVRVVLALAILVRTAHAGDCDPAEVTALRDHLTAASDKANTWNFAWRLTFTVAAVGTGVAGAFDILPSLELQRGLYASSGKAAIGALARWILPLRLHVPAASSDACADVAALRKEVTRVARKERGLFWMGHLGGILVNLGGAAYVYYYDGLGKAALSIAIGYPVGVLSNYTMPRGTWKLYREREASWQVTSVGILPRRAEDGSRGWVLGVGGTW